ncbi:hypothetical protein [Thermocrinis sp.]|uniref:hypothetical protein n=1 Tax=Thermocrinis sp. TaxID=2024383 RepID=UPI002FDD3DDE
MIKDVVRYQNKVSLYFDSLEEKILFSKILKGLEGVEAVEEKERTKTLRVVFRKGSPADYLLSHLSPKRESSLTKEDLFFYINPFLKHPATKLAFSVFTFGFSVGLLSFALCSMFIIPTLKTTFWR